MGLNIGKQAVENKTYNLDPNSKCKIIEKNCTENDDKLLLQQYFNTINYKINFPDQYINRFFSLLINILNKTKDTELISIIGDEIKFICDRDIKYINKLAETKNYSECLMKIIIKRLISPEQKNNYKSILASCLMYNYNYESHKIVEFYVNSLVNNKNDINLNDVENVEKIISNKLIQDLFFFNDYVDKLIDCLVSAKKDKKNMVITQKILNCISLILSNDNAKYYIEISHIDKLLTLIDTEKNIMKIYIKIFNNLLNSTKNMIYDRRFPTTNFQKLFIDINLGVKLSNLLSKISDIEIRNDLEKLINSIREN